ncbi:aminoglycoside phosphotransferase family protein, partial [Patescibacteria group bacterium]|nr:aminoglycoside phosphotransferase family protein [Patescibacteria group bacterium]
QSPYKFKKSVRYTLKLKYPDSKIETKVIRANVPSAHQDWEIKNSDQAMKAIYDHGFDKGRYQITRPLGHYPEWRMLVYEEYPGEIFTDLLLAGKQRLEKKTLLASNWVAQFHNLKMKTGRTKTLKRIKEEVGYFVNDYKKFSPELQAEGKLILETFLKRYKKYYRPNQHHLIHGDLNSNNIIFNGNNVGVIDFGNAWRFDRFCDVANYFVQMELLGWQKRAPLKTIHKLHKIFLDNYLKKTNQNTKAAREQIDLWKVWWVMQITAFCVSILIDTKNNREAVQRTIIDHTFPEAKRLLKL